ncbi:MAG: aminotransferase class I/II-fold pyridoxal phosphate-dependent enzyme [Defluviitaleaceae bacterium]|nr:aminotransferase class I/II-fold pyridoxal phosphate-dependent enzyme [Defluviitaleaceae bacterium]
MYKLNQDRLPLLEAMKDYANRDIAAFDVPGHKRGQGVDVLTDYFGAQVMALDTNSLPALDHVGNPTGVIKEAQALLAEAYGADVAFFMANGSTSAIQAMLMSVISPGDRILMPKNSHKSALNGLILCGGIPVYMQPEMCLKEGIMKNVSVDEVRRQLDAHPDIKAVFVLNPTYFGHTSDLKEISKLCHARDVLLLVDEAHGAHFPFHPAMPLSAMASGADISCISVHKTGGALTQSSALVVKAGRVDVHRVQQVVNILQSTSVSYLLMGSLDGARYNLVKNGTQQLDHVMALSRMARQSLNQIVGVSTVEADMFYDLTKLVINVSKLSLTGFEVYELLWRQYEIQLELCETDHVLAVMSLGDCQHWIERLVNAMAEIAHKYPLQSCENQMRQPTMLKDTTVKMSPRDAYFSSKELMAFDHAIGRIAGESIMAYPPGIPIISPGELVTKEVIDVLNDLKAKDAFIVDHADPLLEKILVIKEM